MNHAAIIGNPTIRRIEDAFSPNRNEALNKKLSKFQRLIAGSITSQTTCAAQLKINE